MKWLQNNLPGAVLLGACGALLLISALLALSWASPVSSEVDPAMDPALDPAAGNGQLADLGPIGAYRIVTDRPLFNETRRPVIEVEEVGEIEPVEMESTVADAPNVALTGVVITPDAKVVSLTPEGGGDALVFREGMPMRGEYNGWLVAEIGPRRVVLESTDGETLELSLVVHDESIKAPPRPEPTPAAVAAAAATTSQEDAELAQMEKDLGEERLSRAEEIRQRIAERREQLRQEAADREAASGRQSGGASRQTDGAGGRVSPYQQAVRNLMNNQSKDKKAEDDDDDDP